MNRLKYYPRQVIRLESDGELQNIGMPNEMLEIRAESLEDSSRNPYYSDELRARFLADAIRLREEIDGR